jgi:hypothetical protein
MLAALGYIGVGVLLTLLVFLGIGLAANAGKKTPEDPELSDEGHTGTALWDFLAEYGEFDAGAANAAVEAALDELYGPRCPGCGYREGPHGQYACV